MGILETASSLGLGVLLEDKADQDGTNNYITSSSKPAAEGAGLLCSALDVMHTISRTQVETQSMDREVEGRKLQVQYGDQVGLDVLKRRAVCTRQLAGHLRNLLAVEGQELARRIEIPFHQDNMCMERSLHVRMVEVIEGAFTDVCAAGEELALAEWCHDANLPLKDLVQLQTSFSAELEAYETAQSALVSARHAMRQLHDKSCSGL